MKMLPIGAGFIYKLFHPLVTAFTGKLECKQITRHTAPPDTLLYDNQLYLSSHCAVKYRRCSLCTT